MNFLDLLIIVIMVFCVYTSIKKGFIKLVSEISAFIIAGYVAYRSHIKLGLVVSSLLKSQHNIFFDIISFVVIWLIIFSIINFIGTHINKILSASFLSAIIVPLNIISGIFIGLFKSLLIISVIVVPLLLTSIFYRPVNNFLSGSFFVGRAHKLSTRVIEKHIHPYTHPDAFDKIKKALP